MKNHFQSSLSLHKYSKVIALISVLLIGLLITGCHSGWEIDNPYENVDWTNHHQFKANLHTHTTMSDGHINPQTVIDSYYKLGYSILAITDHNEVTYPWTEFGNMKGSVLSRERLASGFLNPEDLEYESRDPQQLKMIAIMGNELSRHHHMGSFFNDHNGTSSEEESLKATQAKGGLSMFYHPGRYKRDIDWYADFYQRYNHLIGIEAYNKGNNENKDLAIWDSLLTRFMPERTIWGFSNDDMHLFTEMGRNWNVFILPELTEQSVRRGMEEGLFYYIYAPEGHDGPVPPQIKEVKVRSRKGSIEVIATGQDSIQWISRGEVVHRGNTIRLNDYPGLSQYVRAEIFGSGSTITVTQAFGIWK